MLWMTFIAGWLVGSASLYVYLVLSAKEPQNEACMDCRLTDCSECSRIAESKTATRLAA